MNKFSNMADFAAHFGLSRSTVSYILNNKWKERHISEKTARKVLDYAAEMGYTPNFLGLAINGKVSIDVALLLPRETYEHHRQAFFDLLGSIEKQQLRYMVFQLGDDILNQAVIERLRNFKVRRTVIFASPLLLAEKDFVWWRKTTAAVPDTEFCFYDYRYDQPTARDPWSENVFTTGFDNHTGQRAVVNYIAHAGFRKLCVSGWGNVCFARDLLDRFRIDTCVICGNGSGDLFSYGESMGVELLKLRGSSNEPVAVFINDDIATASAMDLLIDHGVDVPGEFAFISWDGLKISRHFRKSLTTLEVPHWQMLNFVNDFILGRTRHRSLEVTPEVRSGKSMPAKLPD